MAESAAPMRLACGMTSTGGMEAIEMALLLIGCPYPLGQSERTTNGWPNFGLIELKTPVLQA